MKKINRLLAASAVALVLSLSGTHVLAQAGGAAGANPFAGGTLGGGVVGGAFDPSQIVPMMVARMRDNLAVTNDDEWKVIEPRLEKVVKLRMAERTSGIGGGGGGMRRMSALAGAPDPSEGALQKLLDDNAPPADIKAAMAKVREAHVKRHAELLKAQQELKDVLTVRQEATLLLSGQLE
jgi:hypothetical protein